MAETIQNGSTCLEQRGMEQRSVELARKTYNKENPYGANHPDALSDGDPNGKGTGSGGHTAFLPDCTKPKNYFNYSNFDTKNGGGSYDINGREGHPGRFEQMNRSLYSEGEGHEYGSKLVNTALNVAQGQVTINY